MRMSRRRGRGRAFRRPVDVQAPISTVRTGPWAEWCCPDCGANGAAARCPDCGGERVAAASRLEVRATRTLDGVGLGDGARGVSIGRSGGSDLDVAVFVRSKSGTEPAEDAVGFDLERRVFVVADGASTSWAAGEWSATLVRSALDEPPRAADFDAWLDRVRAGFLRGTSPAEGAPWFEAAASERGAHATLLVVRVSVGPVGARWESLAVGDACVLHVGAGGLLVSSPIDAVDAFGSTPELITSLSGPAIEPVHARGALADDDVLVLATDASAQYLVRLAEHDPDDLKRALEEDAGTLEARFLSARASGGLVDDDVSLIRLRLASGRR
jgi:hypothetical protein